MAATQSDMHLLMVSLLISLVASDRIQNGVSVELEKHKLVCMEQSTGPKSRSSTFAKKTFESAFTLPSFSFAIQRRSTFDFQQLGSVEALRGSVGVTFNLLGRRQRLQQLFLDGVRSITGHETSRHKSTGVGLEAVVSTRPDYSSGVGLCVLPDATGQHIVTAVAPYTFAKQNGAEPGDKLLSVDGLMVKDLPVTDVIQLLLGAEDSNVVLLLEGSSGNQKMMTIQRRATVPRSPQNVTLYKRLSPALRIVQDWDKALQDLESDFQTAIRHADLSAASAFSVEIGDVLVEAGGDASRSAVKYQEAVDLARAAQDARGEVAAFEKFALAMMQRSGGLSEEGRAKVRESEEAEWRPKGFVEGKKSVMLRQVWRLRRMQRKRADQRPYTNARSSKVFVTVSDLGGTVTARLPEGAEQVEQSSDSASVTFRLDLQSLPDARRQVSVGGFEEVQEEGPAVREGAAAFGDSDVWERMRALASWFKAGAAREGSKGAGGVWMEIEGLNSTLRRDLHLYCIEQGLYHRSWGPLQQRRLLMAGDALTLHERMNSPDRKVAESVDFGGRRRMRRRRAARKRDMEGEPQGRKGGAGFGWEEVRRMTQGEDKETVEARPAFDLESFKFLDVGSWRELMREWKVPMLQPPMPEDWQRGTNGPAASRNLSPGPLQPLVDKRKAGKLAKIPRRTLQ